MEYILGIAVVGVLSIYMYLSRKRVEIEFEKLKMLKDESLSRQRALQEFLDSQSPNPKPRNRGSLSLIKDDDKKD